MTTRSKTTESDQESTTDVAPMSDIQTMMQVLLQGLNNITTAVREEAASTRASFQQENEELCAMVFDQAETTRVQVEEMITQSDKQTADALQRTAKTTVKDEVKSETITEDEIFEELEKMSDPMTNSRIAHGNGKRPLAVSSIDPTKFNKAWALVQPVSDDHLSLVQNLWDSVSTALSATTSTPQSLPAYRNLSILLDFDQELLPSNDHALYPAARATFNSLSQIL